jgi:putative FmdB family regulatory protein
MIYEYQCEKCGKIKEVIQKVNDSAPICCKVPMKKLISPSNFILKGTGWYKTDYADKAGGKNVKEGDKKR